MKTFESILGRMLKAVPNHMDKREGSVIYDALAPCAAELAGMYLELEGVLAESFADTASRQNLIRRARERGLKPKPATPAVVRVESNRELPTGARFRLGLLTYQVTKNESGNRSQMTCEQAGAVGNLSAGNLVPVTYVEGLQWARIVEVVIAGQDEETTEALRGRYFDSFHAQAYGGNVDDYLQKVGSLAGVGAVKVFPVWNGGGTVKVTILDAAHGKASRELIERVQSELDPKQEGKGLGIAPIGHVVTVDTVEDLPVNVSAVFTYESGYHFARIQQNARQTLEAYFLELRNQWAKSDGLVVRLAQVESRLLDVVGVLDITDTKLNGQNRNIAVEASKLPKLGGLNSG